MQTGKLEEYKMLRTEILNCINLNNTLATFCATATGAILAFALANGNPFLFLIPMAIIVPTEGRIFHYRKNVMKISAYMMVFLEPELTDIHWETRHKKLAAPLDADARTGAPPEDGFHSRSLHYGRVFRHYGGFILCLVCYLLFLAYFLPSRDMFPDFWFWPTVLPVAPAAYILVLSVRNHKWLTREKFEKEWRRVQKEEQDAPFVSSHEGA